MENTIFTRFLKALGVRHTEEYSDRRFGTIPFATLFGFSKLCAEYHIPTAGYRLPSPQDMSMLDTPFIAHTGGGLVIVLEYGPEKVVYDTQGAVLSMQTSDFVKATDGTVFLAFPQEDSIEPGYASHILKERLNVGKRVLMWLMLLFLVAYMVVQNHIYSSLAEMSLIVINAAGIFFSTLLVQKGLKRHNKTADKVCGVIEKGGCDTVLDTKASSFFGLFNWSEVGLTYFSVSLFVLLVFPEHANLLGALNICCLPFSFWSVWYQKFRAGAWCTMCLSVQALLWLSFLCYLCGGSLNNIFPLDFSIIVLAISYATVLLFMNRILTFLKQ